MVWRAALLITTGSALSFTQQAPGRDVGAEADSAVVGERLQTGDFDGNDLQPNKNVLDNLVESEQHQPPLSDYMAETDATASDTQPAASKEAKLLLDDYINESDTILSEPQPAASEESEEAKVAEWEAQREASEESEQVNATVSEQPAEQAIASEPQPAANEESEQLLPQHQPPLTYAAEECQVAVPESTCYVAVDWLRKFGFSLHPEWYSGYSSESTFENVQAMLYETGKASCPRPCIGTARAKKPSDCQDVIAAWREHDGGCYDAVAWLKSTGLERHPGWYPGLGTESSAAEIQAELFRLGKANCPTPCSGPSAPWAWPAAQKERAAAAARGVAANASSDCLDAELDTTCHTAVTYGMNEGISKHPNYYEGLAAGSSFKKVQYFLYIHGRSKCAMPCPDAEVDLKTFMKHPEELRVKKRVEDMSVKELGDFFSGQWDGYVSQIKRGDWQGVTAAPLEKRRWDPTTTQALEQQPLPQVDDDSNAVKPEDVAAGQEMASASETDPPVIEPTSNVTAKMAKEAATATEPTAETANATEPTAETATATEPTAETANATEPTAETANVSTEVPEEGDIVGEATPDISNVSTEVPQDGDIVGEAMPDIPNVSTELPPDADIVGEAAPMIDTSGHDEGMTSYEEPRPETREEIEQRIRKQLMEEMRLQTTTTVAAPQETEEEMRQRIKAELMREISQTKDQ